MKKLTTLLLLLTVARFAIAQQPQTQTAPLFAANAKYTNGVAPGYAPTAGSGLTLNIGKGTANCLGVLVEYAGGTLTMTNSTTNYVYLTRSGSCAPASNTSSFASTDIWIAKVTTSGGSITAIDDVRTGFLAPGTGAGTGNVTGPGSSTAHDVAGFADTTGQLLEDTGVPTANLATAASNFTSGNLIKAAANNKTESDSGIAAGDVLHAVAPGLGYAHFPGSSQVPTSVTIPRGISFTIGDPSASSALTSGSTTTDYVTVPFGCTISAYNLLIDTGTITVKFWKIATGTAIPTSSNSISTSGVAISSGTAIHSTTTSDFTSTTVSANDIMAMSVTAVASAHFVNGVLQCDESQ